MYHEINAEMESNKALLQFSLNFVTWTLCSPKYYQSRNKINFAQTYPVLFLLVFHLLPYNRRRSSSCYSFEANLSAFLPIGSDLQLMLNYLASVHAALKFTNRETCILTDETKKI